jgi:hypothetical protein
MEFRNFKLTGDIAQQKQQSPSQAFVTRYEPRIGFIDVLHPVDKQRMIVMKANKKIGKLLRTKRPRPDGYHDPDYEISDSDEEDVVAQLEPNEVYLIHTYQTTRKLAREEIARMTK